MWAFRVLFASLLFRPVVPCYDCLIEMSDTVTLCSAFRFTTQVCFATIDELVSYNPEVIEAGKVGPGHDRDLKDILMDEINSIKDEYYNNHLKQDEKRLQRFAENFIAAASKLPRGSVMEVTLVQVKTRLLTEFEDLTAGVDPNLSIPMVREEHQGTYQCALYSEEVSADIVRLFFFLEVQPKIRPSDTEMQETFDLALAPGGELRIREPVSRPWVLSDVALIGLLTSVFLTAFLHITVMCLLSSGQDCFDVDDDDEEDYIHHYYPQQSGGRTHSR
ncbi:sperm acrosome membrane-associated protein 6 [Neosynchiropus ocellatus]